MTHRLRESRTILKASVAAGVVAALVACASCAITRSGARRAGDEAQATLRAFTARAHAVDRRTRFTIRVASRTQAPDWEIDRRRRAARDDEHRMTAEELASYLRKVSYAVDSVSRHDETLAASREDEGGFSFVARYGGADTTMIATRPGSGRQVTVAPGPVKLYYTLDLMSVLFPVYAHSWDRGIAQMLFLTQPRSRGGAFVPADEQALQKGLEAQFHYVGEDTLAGPVRCHVFYTRRYPQVFFSKIWLEAGSGLLRKIALRQQRPDALALSEHLDSDGGLRAHSTSEIEALQARWSTPAREIEYHEYADAGGMMLPRKMYDRTYETVRAPSERMPRVAVSVERRLAAASFDASGEAPPALTVDDGLPVEDWRHDAPLRYVTGPYDVKGWLDILRRATDRTPVLDTFVRRRDALIAHPMPPIEIARWLGTRRALPGAGRRRIVVFTSASFPAGVAELTLLKAARPRLASRGIEVLLVLRSTDDPEAAEKVLASILPYVHAGLDAPRRDDFWQGVTFDRYAISSIPCTFVIQADDTVSDQGDLATILSGLLQ